MTILNLKILNRTRQAVHLTIAVRQIMHAFPLTIKNIQILMFSRMVKKGGNLVIILGFPHFAFWKENLWTLFVFYYKEM